MKENHIPDHSILFLLKSVKKDSAHLESSFQKNKRMKVKDGNHFPGGSTVKNPPANAGDSGSIPGLEDSPGGGKGNPLQYSCLRNPMDRGAWWATVRGAAKSWK